MPATTADGSSFRRVVEALGDRVASYRDEQVYARCPVPDHDDHAPSLSVTWKSTAKGGRSLVFCQRGCDTRDVLDALGLSLSDLYDTPPARPESSSRGGSPWSSTLRRERKPKVAPPRKDSSSAGAEGQPRRRDEATRPDPIATHVYTDAAGTPVFEVRRFAPTQEWPERYLCATYDRRGQRVVSRKAPTADRRVLYRLPAVRAAAEAGEPVFVVEGEKDVDAAEAAGVAATCNPFGACDTPARAERNWLAQYTEALAGAHVVVVADNDIAGYCHALHVTAALEGVAASLRIVRADLTGKGVDLSDHLAAGYELSNLASVARDELAELAVVELASTSTTKLQSLAAEDARAAAWVQRWGLAVGSAAPAPDSQPATPATSESPGRVIDGPWPTTRDDSDGPGGGGGGAGGGGGSGSGGGDPERRRIIVRDRYDATADGMYKVKYDIAEAADKCQELLSARVRLTRRLVLDLCDGTEPEMTHVDLAADRGGDEATLAAVSRRRWESCSWVAELPWALPFDDTPRGRSQLRNAIQATSDAPLTTMYGALGWQQIGGRWLYLHAGGALGPEGPVEGVRVHAEHLSRFSLPGPPADASELRGMVLASTALLDVAPARVAAPLLGAAYRACLGWCNVTVMPVGGKGSGKTGLAAFAAQHYAPSARYDDMPGAGAVEGAGTLPGLNELRFRAGDMLLPLDDLAPDRGVERASRRGAEIARSQYNRTGRVKSQREGGLAPDHRPRSLPMLTAENSISIESAESRVVSLRVARGEIDIKHGLAMLDQGGESDLRAALTAALVVHYAPSMPITDWLTRTRTTLAAELADDDAVDHGLDARHAGSVAELAAGWRAMLDMAVAREAVTEEEAAELWSRAWAGLLECKRHLMAGSATRTASDRTRELLLALLMRRTVSILGRDGGEPVTPSRFGWESMGEMTGGWRIVGTPAGWTDGEKLWLQPGATYAALVRQAGAENDELTYSRNGLSAALADADVLTTRQHRDGYRVTTVPRKMGWPRTQVAVWEFDLAWLFGPEDDDGSDNNTGDGGGEEPTAPPPAPSPAAVTPAPTSAPASAPSSYLAPLASEPTSMHKTQAAAAAPAEAAAEGLAPNAPSVEEEETATRGDTTRDSAGEASAGRKQQRHPRADLPEFTGPAVVVDADEAWLARLSGPAERLELPQPLTAEVLLEWAEGLNLGHVDGRGKYWNAPMAAGQVWLTTDARRALKLPASIDASARASKARKSLAVAGWEPPKQLGGGWVRLLKDQQVMFVVVPEWLDNSTAMDEENSTPEELATRIGQYAAATGIVLAWSPAVTGVQLSAVTRKRLLTRGAQQLPSPTRTPNVEVDYAAQRAPVGDERDMGWVHLYDWNALYLGAAASLPLPWGEYEHVIRPEVNVARPGYWKVRLPRWTDARLFDPFRVQGREDDKPLWITTPTLKLAVEELEMQVEPIEAHLAVEILAGAPRGPKPWPGYSGARGYGRMLDKWSAELSSARKLVNESGDEALTKAVKATYAHGVGRFDAVINRERSHPLWRPDWRHMIVAQGRYAITRRILQAAQHGRYPLAISTDGLVYAADTPDAQDALPPGFTLGTEVGQVEHQGAAPMSSVADLLSRGSTPARIIYDRDSGEVTRRGLIDTIKGGG